MPQRALAQAISHGEREAGRLGVGGVGGWLRFLLQSPLVAMVTRHATDACELASAPAIILIGDARKRAGTPFTPGHHPGARPIYAREFRSFVQN